MNDEIEVEKQIKTVESVIGERFDPTPRERLKKNLLMLKSVDRFFDETTADRDRKSVV